MYYWSSWTSNQTTITRAEETGEAQPSWRDTDRRLEARREARPVIVIARNRTQALRTPRRGQYQARETGPRISLDVQRQTHSFTSQTRLQELANWRPEATTEEF